MKKILIATLVLLTACGKQEPKDGKDGIDGVTTIVTQTVTQEPEITMVQLCKGTPSYGMFFEFAQCIDHKLYAVYWNGKDAFLAELPPGEYRSTSTGLGCSFTVIKQCDIKN